MSAGAKIAQDKASGQNQLFGFGGDEPEETKEETQVPLVRVPAWTEAETLRQEKDTLGFYVSSHPHEVWSAWIHVLTSPKAGELKS